MQGAQGESEFSEYDTEIGESYASMDKYYREYRRHWLVRACLDQLAFWTMKEGYEEVLEPANPSQFKTEQEKETYLAQYTGLLDYVKQANESVRLPLRLRQVIVKAKIHGHMGFELKRNGLTVTFLAPIRPTDYNPVVNKSWQLVGFSYKGKGTTVAAPFFAVEDVLHFAHDDIDGNYRGISAIEPILKEVQLDDKIVREDLTEAATTMWAPITLWMLDTEKLPQNTTQAQLQKIIDDHTAMIQQSVGRSIVTDARWTSVVITIKTDMEGLIKTSEAMQRRVLGNFHTPRFLVSMEQTGWNRATAFAELEVYVDGPITETQEWLNDELKWQWYDRLTRQWCMLNKHLGKKNPLPVYVRQKWKEIRTTDWFQLIDAVAGAYGNGLIDRPKGYEMLRDGQRTKFDPQEVQQTLMNQFIPRGVTTTKPQPQTQPPATDTTVPADRMKKTMPTPLEPAVVTQK